MRQRTVPVFFALLLAGCAVACSSEVRVADATVIPPRVEIVTATPETAERDDRPARTNGGAQGADVVLVLPTAVAAAPPTAAATGTGAGNTTVVTVIAADGAILRAEPRTSATALMQLPAGRNLAVVGVDISDGTSRWMHVRYGDREGYVRGDLVDMPHIG